MRVSSRDIALGRIVHEDENFVTLEIAKNDRVEISLMPNDVEGAERANTFFTLLFVRQADGGMEVWRGPLDAQ